MKKLFLSLAAAVALAVPFTVSAQTYQPMTLASTAIPYLSTNSTPSTAVQNGFIKKADIYYSFNSFVTNGTVTLLFQSSPDGVTWAQVPAPYLLAGTTNQIVVTLTTTTTNYSGLVTIDLSHGQQFRVGSEATTATTNNPATGTSSITNLTLNYLLPQN